MANPPKPWKAEYAKSSRSSCKTCKNPIEKDTLRLGRMVTATQFDGFMPMWNHASCIFKKINQIKSADDVEGLDLLRWEDQQRINKYIEGGSLNTNAPTNGECTIEIAKSSRSTCKRCNEKIMKGTVRISMKPEGQGPRTLAWHHAKCFMEISPSIALEKLSGWDHLSVDSKEEVSALARKNSLSGSKAVIQDNKEEIPQISSKGVKRRNASSDVHSSKIPKADEDTCATGLTEKGSAGDTGNPSTTFGDLERKLEEQSKALWYLKDELKKHVTVKELREMLEANEQESGGSEYDLRERCADGMLFGPLGKCPICSGCLSYSGGQYRCHGYLSEWSKCNYSTTEPVRLKKKWKIPDGCENQYLCKWFKSQSVKKPVRVLPPSSCKSPSNQVVAIASRPSSNDKLDSLKVATTEVLMAKWKNKLESAGVTVHAKLKKDTSCFVVDGEVDKSDPEIKKARRLKVPVVREDYLADCIAANKRLTFDVYKVEEAKEIAGNSIVTVKVKGRSAVHESSGLQDIGHILEDGNSIYNTTLSMSDLSNGVNSYYILQVIEEDNGSECYVFRKWGRVGNDKIGGTKLEAMPKADAIHEFKRLFFEKTGNTWEAWEQKSDFKKQRGRFFPLDIDYGVRNVPKKPVANIEKSSLPSQVIELMKMLFNVETYRAAMMEFEINMSEMPLGKLSKKNIQNGFEVLTEIQNLIVDTMNCSPSMKESLLVDASNRFFTMIPSIHPHVIRDEDDFKAKVKMLEALQEMEIASRLVGFDCENNNESLDDKYKKLHCEILPLSHDSEDYKLIEKYLLNTHAPTHKEWSLELEDVFVLEREGEFDKYAPYRNKLQNKMLLWHGSRLTNFVGILSQGLRIAPPEAPATGYMFGKGVYFADLVSKSAQYCYVDKKDPVGLLLVSEVALGEMYELKKASYMERPPKGKHSTKGLGKTKPLESEYAKWRDEIVVPCGKPVPSGIRGTELLYNEYIVYDTAQVKMQFLLKVRFHHRR